MLLGRIFLRRGSGFVLLVPLEAGPEGIDSLRQVVCLFHRLGFWVHGHEFQHIVADTVFEVLVDRFKLGETGLGDEGSKLGDVGMDRTSALLDALEMGHRRSVPVDSAPVPT